MFVKLFCDKKGQAWGFDLIVGLMVFTTAILAFYLYSLNYSSEGEVGFVSLEEQGNLIAESLLSSGFPLDWDQNNVARIGIYDDNRINDTKLERFYDFASSDYATTKGLFNVKDDYYISFPSGVTISGNEVNVIGLEPGPSYENLVKVGRVVIEGNKVKTMEVFVWS